MILFLLLPGCGESGPDTATVCASIDESSETVRQLAASANTQGKLLGDMKGQTEAEVTEDRFHRQGEPHRTEAHHRTMYTALCEPLAEAARALAAHAPGPHDKQLTDAADALSRRCADPTAERGAELQAVAHGVDRAVADLRETCATYLPGEDEVPRAPEPAIRCATNQAVMNALLGPVGQLSPDAAALEDRREVMRAVAAQPFESGQVADALVQLGEIEGRFGVRCGNLLKLSLDLAQRHGGPLRGAIGQLRALKKRCEEVPSFDMREPESETHDADAVQVGLALRELYKSARAATDEAFANCAPTPAE